jgi:hypothetical protein
VDVRRRIAIAVSVACIGYVLGGIAFIAAQILQTKRIGFGLLDVTAVAAIISAFAAWAYLLIVAPQPPRGARLRPPAIWALLLPSDLSRLAWRVSVVALSVGVLLRMIWTNWRTWAESIDKRPAARHEQARRS